MTWRSVPLREIGTWYGGGTPSKSRTEYWTDGSIPWLSPKDMGPEVLPGTRDKITPSALSGSAARLVPAQSIAVVMRSGILERTLPVALVPFETTLNQDMKAVVPHPGVDPRWVAWGLRAFEQELLSTTRKAGTTVASIEFPRFQHFKLPVPDPAEQHRTLEILEAHLSALDGAAAALGLAAKRTTAMIASAQGRLLAESRRCAEKMRSIGEVAVVGTGTTPSRSQARYYAGGRIPWITSGDLSEGDVSQPTQFVTKEAIAETSLRIYPAGTLLVAMYGEGKTRGMVAELKIFAAINQACAAIQVKEEELRPWVRAILDASYLGMRRIASGGVQPNLNLGMIRRIEIPIPKVDVRRRLLDDMHGITEAARALQAESLNVDRRAAVLRRAVLTAAFEGRLTKGPTDQALIGERACAG